MRVGVAVLVVFLLCAGGCATERGPRYLDVGTYSEGLAPAQASNGKWGFINERQVWVVSPRYQQVKPFSNGKAAAQMNGKWGFINSRGQWL